MTGRDKVNRLLDKAWRPYLYLMVTGSILIFAVTFPGSGVWRSVLIVITPAIVLAVWLVGRRLTDPWPFCGGADAPGGLDRRLPTDHRCCPRCSADLDTEVGDDESG